MNEEIENYLKHLLPSELEKIEKFIENVFNIKINQRFTNLEYLKKIKIVACPVDENHHIKKNGHQDGNQRYFCHDCHSSFSLTYNSILNHSHLTYDELIKLMKCMYDFKSIKETALELGMSETGIFELQTKLFILLDEINSNTILKGNVQIDEMYEATSFKGFPKNKMPRKSRHNGTSHRISGISNDQVCTIVEINENDNMIIKVAGNGPASTEMISNVLKGQIAENSVVVTDSKSSYIDFCEKENLKLVQIPSGEHKCGDYHINDVNELITEITNYISKKKKFQVDIFNII